jgi:hypothetical protein
MRRGGAELYPGGSAAYFRPWQTKVMAMPKPDGHATIDCVCRDGMLEPELLPGVRSWAATLFL